LHFMRLKQMLHEHALRRYRRNKGISLEDLARQAGVTKGTLSRIETGKQEASPGLIRRLIALSAGRLSSDDFIFAPVGQSTVETAA